MGILLLGDQAYDLCIDASIGDQPFVGSRPGKIGYFAYRLVLYGLRIDTSGYVGLSSHAAGRQSPFDQMLIFVF